MIIDMHAPIMDRWDGLIDGRSAKGKKYGWVEFGTQRVRWLSPLFTETNCTAELLVECMDWAGVDKAVTIQGMNFVRDNEYLIESVERFSERIIGFGIINPHRSEDPIQELENMEQQGLRGIFLDYSIREGFHQLWPLVRLNEKGMMPFWERCAERNLIVDLDLQFPGDPSYQVDELHELIDRFPSLRFLICHLAHPGPGHKKGWEAEWKRQVELALHPNVYLKITDLSLIVKGSFNSDAEYPFPEVQEFIHTAYDIVGAEHLLWGSGFPFTAHTLTYVQSLDLVRKHCDFLSEQEKGWVLGGNAQRVLGYS